MGKNAVFPANSYSTRSGDGMQFVVTDGPTDKVILTVLESSAVTVNVEKPAVMVFSYKQAKALLETLARWYSEHEELEDG